MQGEGIPTGCIYIPDTGWVFLSAAIDESVMKRVEGLAPDKRLMAYWAIAHLVHEEPVSWEAGQGTRELLGDDLSAAFFQIVGFLRSNPTSRDVARFLYEILEG